MSALYKTYTKTLASDLKCFFVKILTNYCAIECNFECKGASLVTLYVCKILIKEIVYLCWIEIMVRECLSMEDSTNKRQLIAILGWSLPAIEAVDKLDRPYVVVGPPDFQGLDAG